MKTTNSLGVPIRIITKKPAENSAGFLLLWAEREEISQYPLEIQGFTFVAENQRLRLKIDLIKYNKIYLFISKSVRKFVRKKCA